MGNELNELECGLKELRDDPVKFVEYLINEGIEIVRVGAYQSALMDIVFSIRRTNSND